MTQRSNTSDTNGLDPVLQAVVQATVDMHMVADMFLLDLRCIYVLIKRIDAMAGQFKSLPLTGAELDNYLAAYAQTMLDLNNSLPKIVATREHLHHLFETCDGIAEGAALSSRANAFSDVNTARSIIAAALRACEETHRDLEEAVDIIEAGSSRLARVVYHYSADDSGAIPPGEIADEDNVTPNTEKFDVDKFCRAVLTALMEEQAARDESYEEIGN